jgi:hypothetical protein
MRRTLANSHPSIRSRSAQPTRDAANLMTLVAKLLLALLARALPLTGPQRAAIGIAQQEFLAGDIIGDLAGLKQPALSPEAPHSYGVARGKDHRLFSGKPGRSQFHSDLAGLAGLDDQTALVGGGNRAGEGQPLLAGGLGYAGAVVLPLALTTTALALTALTPTLTTTALPLALALPLAAILLAAGSGPQRTTVGIAQQEFLAGGFIVNLSGLELSILLKTLDGYGIAGVESDALLVGKAGLSQLQLQLALLVRVDQQALGVKGDHRAVPGLPLMLNHLRLAVTLALPLSVTALASALPLASALTLTLTLPLAVTLTLSLASALTLPLTVALALTLARSSLAHINFRKIQGTVALVGIVSPDAHRANDDDN